MAEPRTDYLSQAVDQLRQDLRRELAENRQALAALVDELRRSDRMSAQQEGRLQSAEMRLRELKERGDRVDELAGKYAWQFDNVLPKILQHERLLFEGNGGIPAIRQEMALFRAWHATFKKVLIALLVAATLTLSASVLSYQQDRAQLKARLARLEAPPPPP